MFKFDLISTKLHESRDRQHPQPVTNTITFSLNSFQPVQPYRSCLSALSSHFLIWKCARQQQVAVIMALRYGLTTLLLLFLLIILPIATAINFKISPKEELCFHEITHKGNNAQFIPKLSLSHFSKQLRRIHYSQARRERSTIYPAFILTLNNSPLLHHLQLCPLQETKSSPFSTS